MKLTSLEVIFPKPAPRKCQLNGFVGQQTMFKNISSAKISSETSEMHGMEIRPNARITEKKKHNVKDLFLTVFGS